MIISASRRTDIPAFFSEWFFNRIKEGYLLVPNPFNAKMVSRISLHPELIDCIVFWTKNPAPMLGRLHELCHYKYYFQYTLNPYGHDIENNLPPLEQRIETFKQLSEKIGKEKIIWRYDPILTNEKYDTAFHRKAFAEIAARLNGYTETCMLGFIDHYPHIRTAARQFHIDPLTRQEIGEMAASFLETTTGTSIRLNTCTVKIDLSGLGIPPGMCIDHKLIEQLTGYPISAHKDKNQRDVCHCVESIDIGTYDTCPNGCIYCYAIKTKNNLRINLRAHDKNSPKLIGHITPDDIIKNREMHSLRTDQLSLF